MKAWDDFLSSLEPLLGVDAVSFWLKPIKVTRFDAANIYLSASPFQQAWFEEHVRQRISLYNNNQRPIRIHWEQAMPTHRSSAKGRSQISPDPLEKECCLNSFLPSSANEIPLQMALELSKGEKPAFNPVYFFGGTGVGKTHLLMGIAAALKERGRNVFYVKAETFTDHVVHAIRLGLMQNFRDAYREIDTLIMEDIHVLARRNATQEEFFHTFNRLHTSGRQIILSARLPPTQLQEIEPRLVSRFEWGIALKLEAPDSLLLPRILEQKATLLNARLTPELSSFFLKRFTSNPKAPIEALHALMLRAPTCSNPLQAAQFLSDLLTKEGESVLTPEKIIKLTATHFGIRVEDLKGKSQMREFAQPRQIAMYFCRNLLQMPFQTIGRLFGRDHSTVMTSIRSVTMAVEEKTPPFADSVGDLKKILQ